MHVSFPLIQIVHALILERVVPEMEEMGVIENAPSWFRSFGYARDSPRSSHILEFCTAPRHRRCMLQIWLSMSLRLSPIDSFFWLPDVSLAVLCTVLRPCEFPHSPLSSLWKDVADTTLPLCGFHRIDPLLS